jgi:co-chaperonin GroES (HSP10)
MYFGASCILNYYNMKAVKDKIIIEIGKEEWNDNGKGVLLHESLELPTEGTINAIGPLYRGELKCGDKVKFREQPGELFKYNDSRFYITTESKIHGKLDS